MMGSAATKTSKDKTAAQVEGHSQKSSQQPALSGNQAGITGLQELAGNRAVNQALDSENDNAHQTGVTRDSMDHTANSELKTLPSANATVADAKGLPPAVRSVLTGGGGSPLEPGIRRFMESRFGYDFSPVRIHTSASASDSARQVNAAAYTVGKDVVFGEGRYAPGSLAGKELMAHELAHTVQQHPQHRNSPPLSSASRSEQEASVAANAVLGGQHVAQQASTAVGIARQELVENDSQRLEDLIRQIETILERQEFLVLTDEYKQEEFSTLQKLVMEFMERAALQPSLFHEHSDLIFRSIRALWPTDIRANKQSLPFINRAVSTSSTVLNEERNEERRQEEEAWNLLTRVPGPISNEAAPFGNVMSDQFADDELYFDNRYVTRVHPRTDTRRRFAFSKAEEVRKTRVRVTYANLLVMAASGENFSNLVRRLKGSHDFVGSDKARQHFADFIVSDWAQRLLAAFHMRRGHFARRTEHARKIHEQLAWVQQGLALAPQYADLLWTEESIEAVEQNINQKPWKMKTFRHVLDVEATVGNEFGNRIILNHDGGLVWFGLGGYVYVQHKQYFIKQVAGYSQFTQTLEKKTRGLFYVSTYLGKAVLMAASFSRVLAPAAQMGLYAIEKDIAEYERRPAPRRPSVFELGKELLSPGKQVVVDLASGKSLGNTAENYAFNKGMDVGGSVVLGQVSKKVQKSRNLRTDSEKLPATAKGAVGQKPKSPAEAETSTIPPYRVEPEVASPEVEAPGGMGPKPDEPFPRRIRMDEEPKQINKKGPDAKSPRERPPNFKPVEVPSTKVSQEVPPRTRRIGDAKMSRGKGAANDPVKNEPLNAMKGPKKPSTINRNKPPQPSRKRGLTSKTTPEGKRRSVPENGAQTPKVAEAEDRILIHDSELRAARNRAEASLGRTLTPEEIRQLDIIITFEKTTSEKRAMSEKGGRVESELHEVPGERGAPYLRRGERMPGTSEVPPRIKKSEKDRLRKKARKMAEAELMGALNDPSQSNPRTQETLGYLTPDQVEDFLRTKALPEGMEFDHYMGLADFLEWGHLSETGVILPRIIHRAGGHGTDVTYPRETASPRDPNFEETYGFQVDRSAKKHARGRQGEVAEGTATTGDLDIDIMKEQKVRLAMERKDLARLQERAERNPNPKLDAKIREKEKLIRGREQVLRLYEDN